MNYTKFDGGKARLFAGSALTAVAMTFATPALAQDEDDSEDASEESAGAPDTAEGEGTQKPAAIIVSGSRIARPNLDSPVPVTSVSADELLNDGSLSLGDALNDLPSLRSTFSSSNSQRFIGTTGLNLLDLRGLGTSRTLVLVNGRRHISGSAGDFRVDVNTIPFQLLDRVDTVTGGTSAVYGSDAIAGVVNFIMKRDFDGFEINGQSGVSDRGDNGRYTIAATYGKNFADGRGNISLVAEYNKLDRVLNSQRPDISGFGIGRTEFLTVDQDDEVSNSDGIPDLELRSNLFIDFISEGGTVATFCRGTGAQPNSCPGDQAARYRFGNDGRLFREFNAPFPGSSRAQGGTGTSLSDGTHFPDIDSFKLNALAHFDISDAFRPYLEAKYVRVDALGQGTPSFFNSFCDGLNGLSGLDPSCTQGLTSSPFFISFDNAYLHPDDAATIQNDIQGELLTAFGAGFLTPASQGFFINRNNSDFGTRNDDLKRETYRFVAGVEGDISSNTRYDLSFTYGQFKSEFNQDFNLVYERARNAVDAVNVGGNIVCRINADADTTNDDPNCVPLNVLGAGMPSAAAIAYIHETAQLFEEAKQYDLLGYINTDTSGFLELPGGPISFSFGGEWRREEAFSEPDAFSATGATFFNAFDTFDPPAMEVKEAFAEVSIPLLADTPFFEELTVSGAARISDYNSGAGLTGSVWAYNGNVTWSPIADLRLRANYSRAVRSPTLSDLFSAQTQNFVFIDDPCDTLYINNGSGTRAANCAAAGVPVGYNDPVTGNNAILQGGNELLKAETSDSYTIGGVFEPSFLPGFSLTIDYYNIEVNNVIASLSAQQVLDNCYDATDLNNNFCDQINPRLATGQLDPDAALILGPVNFAKLTAEGIDFDASYEKTFDNDDRLSLRFIATHSLDRTNFLDVDNPNLPDVVRGELGDPEWAANFNASYRMGDFTLSYSARFVDKQYIGEYEDYNESIQVCPASGASANLIPRTSTACTGGELVTAPPLNPDLTAEVFYPKRITHDIRMNVNIQDEFNFYMGVDNLTDKLPPFGLSGGGSGSGIFNNIGRYFYAGFTAEF